MPIYIPSYSSGRSRKRRTRAPQAPGAPPKPVLLGWGFHITSQRFVLAQTICDIWTFHPTKKKVGWSTRAGLTSKSEPAMHQSHLAGRKSLAQPFKAGKAAVRDKSAVGTADCDVVQGLSVVPTGLGFHLETLAQRFRAGLRFFALRAGAAAGAKGESPRTFGAGLARQKNASATGTAGSSSSSHQVLHLRDPSPAGAGRKSGFIIAVPIGAINNLAFRP